MAQDNKDFTLEDILAEQRAQREQEAAQSAARPAAPQQKPKPHPLAQQGGSQPPVRQAAAPRQEPAPPQPEETADLNDFATGTVTRNGEVLQEAYISAPTTTGYDVAFPLTVPQGQVFLMGDNRPRSKDSRSSEIGCVDERALLGKVVLRIRPLERFGAIS